MPSEYFIYRLFSQNSSIVYSFKMEKGWLVFYNLHSSDYSDSIYYFSENGNYNEVVLQDFIFQVIPVKNVFYCLVSNNTEPNYARTGKLVKLELKEQAWIKTEIALFDEEPLFGTFLNKTELMFITNSSIQVYDMKNKKTEVVYKNDIFRSVRIVSSVVINDMVFLGMTEGVLMCKIKNKELLDLKWFKPKENTTSKMD